MARQGTPWELEYITSCYPVIPTYKRSFFAELNFVSALLSKRKLCGIYPLWDGPPSGALNPLNIIGKCIGKFEAVSLPTIVGLAHGLFLIEYLQSEYLYWISTINWIELKWELAQRIMNLRVLSWHYEAFYNTKIHINFVTFESKVLYFGYIHYGLH